MKIVSWNCKCGFTKEKAKDIEVYGADVLVIQECRQTDFDQEKSEWTSHDFYCDEEDSKLGVAVFSKKYVITRDDKTFNKENRYVIPYNITGTEKPFALYSVWTKKPDKASNYHTSVYNVLKELPLPAEQIIFIGDFNTGSIQGTSNANWYEGLYREFAMKDFMNCANGQEWVPTFFRGNNSWLDDHCFASTDFQVISFGIGNFDYWRKYSDHCPIIIDFDF